MSEKVPSGIVAAPTLGHAELRGCHNNTTWACWREIVQERATATSATIGIAWENICWNFHLVHTTTSYLDRGKNILSSWVEDVISLTEIFSLFRSTRCSSIFRKMCGSSR